MSGFQNIVVIGASQGGCAIANALVPDLPRTHRVLMIDALDFGFWPLSSLRAAVVPGWEKRLTVPLHTNVIFSSGSDHQVIAPNKVVELRKSSVVLEKPFEGSTEIPFYRCVIATGAQQPTPMRPAPDSTEQEYQQLLVNYQQETAKATKIVIIGAGAVGVEFAGEIRAVHSKPAITLITKLSSVLNPTANPPDLNKVRSTYSAPPTAPKLSVALEKDLKALKINLITNETVNTKVGAAGPNDWDGSFGLQSGVKTITTQSGKKIEADYVFVSVGNKPNVSIVQNADPGALVSGLVGVDEYLKVISTNKSSPLTGSYYAIGDCCSTPGWKNVQGAQTDGNAAAKNILAEIKKTSLKVYQRPLPIGMLVPLGPNGGQGTLTLPYLGQTMVPVFMVKMVKAKKLFTDDLFFGRYKGSEKHEMPPLTA